MTRNITLFEHNQFVWGFIHRLFKNLTNYNKNFKNGFGVGYSKCNPGGGE